MDIEEPKSCPCKRIPMHLSSFTAAEYGDSAALRSRLLSKKSSSQHKQQRQCPTLDSAGNTPLHFAAQHGHTETVAMLLRTGAYDNMYCNNNTNAMNSDNIQLYQMSGVTPLHRACYSGAIGTVRLLLEHIITIVAKNTTNNNNDNNNSNEHVLTSILLLPDTSFNDYQTPLHKCVSGGRYLVVQLLLDFMAHHHLHHHDSTIRNSTLLLLSAKDAFGRTPLDVAREKQQRQHLLNNNNNNNNNNDNERQSVQRWDTVAGGYADWDICVQVCLSSHKQKFLCQWNEF
jgi:ankyrin repeat protein